MVSIRNGFCRVVGDHCYPYVSGQSREPGHCLIPKRDYT